MGSDVDPTNPRQRAGNWKVSEMPSAPKIPFNKPFIAGKELYYIAKAVALGTSQEMGCSRSGMLPIAGRTIWNRPRADDSVLHPALEMAAILRPGAGRRGDHALLHLRLNGERRSRLGAQPVFVDIRPDTLNIDEA